MVLQIVQKSTTSKDNSTISYLEYTSPTSTSTQSPKPGLIILHGGLESSYSHSDLAATLCSSLTIYLPDRRGRGASSAHGTDFNMQTEIDDLEALLLATGAQYVLGISSGAMIALYGALAVSGNGNGKGLIKKLVAFEPPIVLDDFSAFECGRGRFEREIDEGKTAESLITALKMTEMGNWFLRLSPRWLLVPLVRWAFEKGEKGESVGAEGDRRKDSMGRLAPTLRFDFRLVKEMQDTMEKLTKLNEMDVDVLLISASRSPRYLRRNVEELERFIPKANHVPLQGLDHLGLGNRDVGGKPEQVAVELTNFLISH